MKIKYILLTLFVLLLLSGCIPTANDDGMSKIANDNQINIYFQWKDIELEEGSSFMVVLLEKRDGGLEFTRSRVVTVTESKLALCIRAVSRELSIEDLYLPVGKMRNPSFDSVEESSRSWEIQPLLDDYIIYLDDYIVNDPHQDTPSEEPLELCNIIDKNTDETFNYSLLYIYSNDIQSGE